jgi:hypothetical protein
MADFSPSLLPLVTVVTLASVLSRAFMLRLLFSAVLIHLLLLRCRAEQQARTSQWLLPLDNQRRPPCSFTYSSCAAELNSKLAHFSSCSHLMTNVVTVRLGPGLSGGGGGLNAADALTRES